MKILFVLPQLPYPPESGGRIVTFEIIKFLLPRHQLAVATLFHRPEDLLSARTLEQLGVEIMAENAPKRKSLMKFGRSLVSGRPYKIHRFFSSRLAKRIQQALRSENFDVVHAQNFYMAQYVTGNESCLKVHYKENFEGLLLNRYADTIDSPIKKRFWRREARKTIHSEIEIAKRFDEVFCISHTDAEQILKCDPGFRYDVLPACIDPSENECKREESLPPMVLFLGTLSYFPNIDGARFFVQRVWPLIRKKSPRAEFHICGHNPDKSLLALQRQPGVKIIGPVDTLCDVLSKCAVFVIPLRIGGGVRLKLIQALAARCAVVSSSIGAEGLNLEADQHLRIADSPQDFAQAVIELLHNDQLRKEMGERGRKQVQREYSPAAVLPKLEKAYLEGLSRS